MNLTAIIIEDEQKGRDALRNLIIRFCPDVTVVGEAITVKQGANLILDLNPDIVFLDIELPQQNGFSILEYFPEPEFAIIFTTAYDHFAVQAFRISAVDYLLKPIDFQLLQKAVEKVKQKQLTPQRKTALDTLSHNINNSTFNKIALPIATGFIFIELSDIIFCKADRNYTLFQLQDGKKHIVSKPLRHFEELLQNLHFFRINRSVIVNLQQLQSYSRTKTGEIILKTGETFALSEQKKKRFLEHVNLFTGA